MRCAICGTEIQGQPSHCPRCGTQLYYEPGAVGQGQSQGQTPQTNPQGPWPGAQPGFPPGYGGYPPEGQTTPPGYGPAYPQYMPPGPAYGAPAPPSTPLGAYPPPGSPYGAGAPPGAAPGYQTPYPPGYGQYGQGQPYPPYAAPATTPFGAPAPATTPFAPAAPAARRRVNPLVIVLSIVCAVVVIAGAGAGVVYLTQGAHSGNPATGVTVTGPTNTPNPTLLYQNTLTSPDSGWQQDANCFFRSDGYHIVGFHLCFAPISDQKNVDITVDMDTLSGDFGSPHGIFFRHNSNPDRYEFDVDPYGHWTFYKCLAAQNKCLNIVDFTPNSAIHGGLHAVNTLEAIAAGSHFTFKINGTQVGTADDSDLSVGAVGLAGNDNSEVVFSNLKITLPQQ